MITQAVQNILLYTWRYVIITYDNLSVWLTLKRKCRNSYYNDVIMGTIASQTTTLTIVYSTVYSGAYQRKHQSSASLAFVRGIHRGHKWPVTRKMFPFDDVIMSLDPHQQLHQKLLKWQPPVQPVTKVPSKRRHLHLSAVETRPMQIASNLTCSCQGHFLSPSST